MRDKWQPGQKLPKFRLRVMEDGRSMKSEPRNGVRNLMLSHVEKFCIEETGPLKHYGKSFKGENHEA